jgi:DnaJ-class molecular chaperone
MHPDKDSSEGAVSRFQVGRFIIVVLVTHGGFLTHHSLRNSVFIIFRFFFPHTRGLSGSNFNRLRQKIQEAYAVLSDPIKRRQYDDERNGVRPADEDAFSDLFRSFFFGFGGPRGFQSGFSGSRMFGSGSTFVVFEGEHDGDDDYEDDDFGMHRNAAYGGRHGSSRLFSDIMGRSQRDYAQPSFRRAQISPKRIEMNLSLEELATGIIQVC